MKKIINCKPVDEIELQFSGGEKVTLRFDVEALMKLSEMDGGLTALTETCTMTETCARIMASGAANMSIEEARGLVSELSLTTIMDIVNAFSESMGEEKKELQGEVAKKMMARFADKKLK